MLSQLLEYNNPLSRIIVDNEFEDSNILIEGFKNNKLGIYTSNTNKFAENDENYISFPNGPKGILHQDVEYLLRRYGDRNYYANINSPANIYKEFSPQDLNINEFEYRKNFDLIRSGIHDLTYRPYMSKYLQTISILETNLDFAKFDERNKMDEKMFLAYIPNYKDFKVPEVKIDKKIIQALKDPEDNFKFLEEKLTLDPDSGFYMYNNYRCICKHEMMIYRGDSYKDIINDCANDRYLCQFCGSPLVYDVENELMVNFNNVQYRLIYLFVRILALTSHEETIQQILITNISSSIEKLEITEGDFQSLSEAFTATYLYKLYKELKKQFKMKFDAMFLNFVNDIWTKNGWNSSIVNKLMKNEERFVNFHNCTDLIIRMKESDKTVDEKNTIIQVIMDKFSGKGNLIQQIFIKDKSALGEMVRLIMLMENNYTQLEDFDKITKNSDSSPFTKPTIKMNMFRGSSSEAFFSIWWKDLCPVNTIHQFEKGTCKYCKINKDNVHEIYLKYRKEIEEMVNPLKDSKVNYSTHSREKIIEMIKKSPDTIPAFLSQKVTADVYKDSVRKILEEYVGIGKINEIPTTKENNYRILNYLIKNTTINIDSVKIDLESLIIEGIRNIGNLVLKF